MRTPQERMLLHVFVLVKHLAARFALESRSGFHVAASSSAHCWVDISKSWDNAVSLNFADPFS